MRSDIDIKDILFGVIKGSPLEAAVISKGGKLYKDSRPTNSGKEDILVSVLDGLNGQIQDSIVNVNIYVPNVNRGTDSIENAPRIRELSRLAIELLEVFNGNGYRFVIEKQQCLKINSVDEHCINNRIKLKHTNF